MLSHFSSVIFSRLDELLTLSIRGRLDPGVFKADPLMSVDSGLWDQEKSAVYFPKLRELEFSCVAFDRELIAELHDWLSQRRRLKLTVQTLRLSDCRDLLKNDIWPIEQEFDSLIVAS